MTVSHLAIEAILLVAAPEWCAATIKWLCRFPGWKVGRVKRRMRSIALNRLSFLRMIVTSLVGAFALVMSAVAVAWAAPTYVERGGFDSYLRHPSLLSFSVDGDLEGLHLRWEHWGAGFTIAQGKIFEREGYPSYSSRTVPGAIRLDRVRWCNGARYYTQAVVYPYAPLLFKAGPIHLLTPCNGG